MAKEYCMLHSKELKEMQHSLIRIETTLEEMKEYRLKREAKEEREEEEAQALATRVTILETQRKSAVFFAGILGGIISFLVEKFWK